MTRFINLAGQRFGRLTVLNDFKREGSHTYWECRCDCGVVKSFTANNMRQGNSRSCGCHKSRLITEAKTRHGLSHAKEHNAWLAMKARCYQDAAPGYENYGGRGIMVCERWLSSFDAFYEDIGKAPSPQHSIDRINNDGNYEPGNCRWATRTEQSRNRRSNILVDTPWGKITLIEASEKSGVNYSKLRGRWKRGLVHPDLFN